ncbi:hypothetical protein H0H92_012175 [Tricholoma furcatifolium]|nr:hypothetical protein H0H92_012175 [Tricholoma furcatifolium]
MVHVLHQLSMHSLVEAGVSQEELQQILTQLCNLVVRSNTKVPPVPGPAAPTATRWQQPPFPPSAQPPFQPAVAYPPSKTKTEDVNVTIPIASTSTSAPAVAAGPLIAIALNTTLEFV